MMLIKWSYKPKHLFTVFIVHLIGFFHNIIGELIKTASGKTEFPDYNSKHGNKAKFGWYRYFIRFGIPVYDEDGVLERYNIFQARMMVRCDKNGKLYLYDIVTIKKETSRPLES